MRVGLFVTCLGDTLFPSAGQAVVRLLERLGVEVEFPEEQTCCGQMHLNSGYAEEGLALARRLAGVFDGYEAVVTPSASCAGMLREQIGADALPVYELSEFLVDVLGVEEVGAYYPHRVTYHPTCHSLRALRVLSASIAVETSAFFTANVPPNPQQVVASGSSTRSMPRTARSRRSGRSPTFSRRSPWHVGW